MPLYLVGNTSNYWDILEIKISSPQMFLFYTENETVELIYHLNMYAKYIIEWGRISTVYSEVYGVGR